MGLLTVEACARAVVQRLDGLADHMGLADPGALGVWEADGDGVAGLLEVVDEAADVGGRVVARRPVIVGYEDVHGCGSEDGYRGQALSGWFAKVESERLGRAAGWRIL